MTKSSLKLAAFGAGGFLRCWEYWAYKKGDSRRKKLETKETYVKLGIILNTVENHSNELDYFLLAHSLIKPGTGRNVLGSFLVYEEIVIIVKHRRPSIIVKHLKQVAMDQSFFRHSHSR